MSAPPCSGCGESYDPGESPVIEQRTEDDQTQFTGRVFHPECWPHGFHPAQIRRVPDWQDTPDPGKDAHWWTVALRRGQRPGWIYVARSIPPPSVEWIVQELTRLRARYGNALEGRLMAQGGMHLEGAPRPDDG